MLKPAPLTAFLDGNAKAQTILGLALPDRVWFSRLQQQAATILNDRDLNEADTFADPFKRLVATCLEMAGLHLGRLDQASVFRLLFECQEGQGAIAQLNGLVQQSPISDDPLKQRQQHQRQYARRLEKRQHRLYTKGIIQSLNGCIQRVAGLTLSDRDYCLHLLESVSNGQLLSAYDTDAQLRMVVDECLLLNGINPYWIDLPMLEALLTSEENGRSLLIEWNFPNVKSDEAGAVDSDVDPLLSNLDSLWSFAESLDVALSIAATEPWSVVQSLLKVNSDRVAAMYDKDGKLLPPKNRAKKVDSKPDQWFLDLMESGEIEGLTQLAREKDGATN